MFDTIAVSFCRNAVTHHERLMTKISRDVEAKYESTAQSQMGKNALVRGVRSTQQSHKSISAEGISVIAIAADLLRNEFELSVPKSRR